MRTVSSSVARWPSASSRLAPRPLHFWRQETPFAQALTGRFRTHHGLLVGQLLAHLDYLDEAIDALSAQIDILIAPFTAEMARLDTIPGVAKRTAEVLIAEIGVDMSVFPTAGHLASWAGLCPGNNESAGKHKSGKTRKGNRWLRGMLIEAASAATRTSNTALSARYRRIMRHRGHKKAVVAVAHAILVAAYHLLARQVPYRELGPDTTTGSMLTVPNAGRSKRLSVRDTVSFSNPPHEREPIHAGDFLSIVALRDTRHV